MEDELEAAPREITDDQDADDGEPTGQDAVPDVREDAVPDDANLAGDPPVDAVTES